jgi:hypothetical protein
MNTTFRLIAVHIGIGFTAGFLLGQGNPSFYEGQVGTYATPDQPARQAVIKNTLPNAGIAGEWRLGQYFRPNGSAAGPNLGVSAFGENEKGQFWLGEPLEDVQRYCGVYGSAEQPNRDFFVTEAKRPPLAERAPEIPPGYLMIGAMWGDVSPWYMKSISATRFEQQVRGDFGPPEPFVVEFELDENGEAVAMTFKTGFEERGRLERKGDLPEGW